MLTEYIQEALNHAHYAMIADEEPFFGEVPELEGVWATGGTIEECRAHLAGIIEGWLLLSIRRGLPIPPLPAGCMRNGGHS
jgi:predicted RNase H-like HicB family nuclease